MGRDHPGSDIDLILVAPNLRHDDRLRLMAVLDDLLLPWSIDLSLHHDLPEPFTSMWPGWGDGSIQAPRSALLLQPLDGRQPLKRHHQDSTSSSMAIAKAAACGTSCTLRSSR